MPDFTKEPSDDLWDVLPGCDPEVITALGWGHSVTSFHI